MCGDAFFGDGVGVSSKAFDFNDTDLPLGGYRDKVASPSDIEREGECVVVDSVFECEFLK